ncbi:ABC multidrug transporter [Aspergillus neoniger CBS 115656]|uniref:ABC multidrug transporter n=1 Tax=Aspergillus neoniger (strain CBS 115656) TaxID=1448310 RepID=A0A318ZQD6_ASPNB|nr:ABC multidrug transporter [Aspergillus neoniger CBS 115656]PYH38032.1 ABC multidrug transporter [Aspergillus neoniger CBS 115656]
MDNDVSHHWLQGREDTIAIILGFIFLVTAGVRIAFLAQESIKVEPSLQQQCKYFFLTTTVTFHFTLLLFPFIDPATGLSTVVAICGFLTAIVLLILSMCEHIRSVAPSTLVPLYVIASLCLDMAQCQRLGYQGQQSVPYTITAMLVLNKVAVILLEALPKRGILVATYWDCSPSDTAGPYSTLLLWWINPLLWKGFFTQLGVNDLYPLDVTLSSQRLGDRFEAERRRSRHLLRAVTRVLKYHILASGLPQLLLIGVKFTQPYLIQDTTRLVMDPVESQKWPAWRLIGTYALIYTGIALLGATSKHQMNRMVVCIRGGLVSLIYNKSVDLSITAVEEKAALTLMSTDIDRITMSCADVHHAWTAVIEVAVALYLLYAQLGVGFLAPGLCFACAVVAMAACTRLYPRYQNAWVEAIQERTSITSTMLGSIRSLKLLGLSAVIGSLLQGLRVHENVVARKIRWITVVQVVFQNVTSIAAPLTTFALYLGWGQSIGKTLNVPVAFSILSLLQLLEPPLMTLVQTLPHLAGALGSFDRIDAFLRSPSRREYRQLAPSTTTTATFEGTNDTVVLENASFGWAEDSPVLRNLHLRIPRGSLVMVVGPTGCGKSTLLKGILGETSWSSGIVSSTSSIGICGQSPEDALLYHEVIDCCGLLEDVNSLPEKDGTKIGSNGIALSGGQRLRLTLARAAFAQKELLVLDDVFSGVDADTEEHIFRRLFSVSGPVRRRATSIILVTHAVSRLPLADWVVVLSKDGTIAEQGTCETLIHKSTGYAAGLNVNFKRIMDNDHDARSHAEHDDVAVKQPAVVEANAVGEEESEMEEAPTLVVDGALLSMEPGVRHRDQDTGVALEHFQQPKQQFYHRIYFVVSGLPRAGSCRLTGVSHPPGLGLIPSCHSPSIERSSSKTSARSVAGTISFFTSTDSGTVLNRFTQDLSVIDNELPGVLIGMMLQLAIFTIGTCMIVASATYLLVTIPLVMMALIEQQAPLYTHFQETIAGLANIRAFGWTGAFRARNAILLDNSQRPMYLLKAVQAWLGLVLNLLVAALGTVLISTIAMLRDTVHPAIVGLGLLNIMSFNENLSELVLVWSLTETSLSALARVRDFIEETESEEKDSEVNSPLTAGPRYGAVEFDNFAAAYSSSAPLVLRDIYLHIQPGEKIGVCGRTGSDLAHLPLSELRQSLNIITQEPFCVHSETVRFNLDPWEATSQDDAILIGALEKCQLWSVIEAKGGLSHLEDGFLQPRAVAAFLPGAGHTTEEQACSVGRGFIEGYCGSVDIETDRRMQEIIRHEFDGCTIIEVAHRLDTIVDFERVVVLADGRIVECGAPQQLLACDESWFKRLYES